MRTQHLPAGTPVPPSLRPAVLLDTPAGVWLNVDHADYRRELLSLSARPVAPVPPVPLSDGTTRTLAALSRVPWPHRGALLWQLMRTHRSPSPALLDAVTPLVSDGGCGCRSHWRDVPKEFHPDFGAGWRTWVHAVHQAVNRRRGVPGISWDEAQRRHAVADRFGAAYVISLAHTPERLDDFYARWPRDWPGPFPEVFPAVKGDAIPVPEGWDWTDSNHGAIGCRASWLAVLDRLIADGVDRPALVMEDDCQWSADAAERLGPTLDALPDGWELLYLGGEHNEPPTPFAPGLVRVRRTGRTHALVIHPRFFVPLRDFWRGYKNHVDWGLRKIGPDRQFFAASPFTAQQRPNWSTLRNRLEPARAWDDRFKPPAGRSERVFHHRGDVGDVLAGLPTMRAASREYGGGDLVICPADFTRQRMSPAIVDSLRPLLEAQPYVRSVRYADAPEGFALDGWRWRSTPFPIYSLADRTLDLLDWSHSERSTPWLTVKPNPVARVVFARSARYRNPRFPWAKVVEKYGRDAVFVGHPDEHADFTRAWGDVPWVETANYLELAQVLAGAELVVVNQTSAYWTALGVGRPVLLEECPDPQNWNCRHDDQGCRRVLHGNETLPGLATRSASLRVAVLSLAIGEGAEAVAAVTFPNKRAYSQRHGYAFVEARRTLAPERPAAWSKVRLIRQHLGRHDWVMWSDADSLFTSPATPLDHLIDSAGDADLVIARDVNGINSGSFLIRNTAAASAFLDAVWAQADFIDHPWWEQAAMAHLIDSGTANIRVAYVDKRSINSYPDDWQPGDLIYHTPGRPDRLRLLTERSAALAE